MIQRNPFLSENFIAIWSEHFAPSDETVRFSLLPSLKFIKHRFWPLFTNVGRTMTKGISYTMGPGISGDTKAEEVSTGADTALSSGKAKSPRFLEELRNKVLLIHDVPTYFEAPVNTAGTEMALLRSRQYPGFLIELDKFKDLNNYLQVTFSKSSRYKLKKYKKRFEASFDVRYVMYRGAMEREQYNLVFDRFRELLEKRFDDKQITNNNLDPREWQFYHEVTYPMLLQNEASLFVIYNGDEPVGVTLNFFSEDILFDAITVFDIDYAKFHLGSVTIMGLLEWCFENGLKIFDFSKGYFDYKTRWATKVYDFEYHILYDSKSARAKLLASGLKKFFDLKQRLREKKVNERLHRMTYRFKKKTLKPLETRGFTFSKKEDISQTASPESQADEPTMNASTENVNGPDPKASPKIESALATGKSDERQSGTKSAKASKEAKVWPVDASTEIDLKNPENHFIKLMVFEFLYLNDGHYRDIKVYRVPQETDQYYIVGKTKSEVATLD